MTTPVLHHHYTTPVSLQSPASLLPPFSVQAGEKMAMTTPVLTDGSRSRMQFVLPQRYQVSWTAHAVVGTF